MFVVDPEPTFVHPVKVKTPIDGGYLDQQFRAKFRVIPVDESSTFDLNDRESTTAFLQRIIVEMYDLVDAADQPVSYNDLLRDKIIANPIVRVAIRDAYYGAISGSKLGN